MQCVTFNPPSDTKTGHEHGASFTDVSTLYYTSKCNEILLLQVAFNLHMFQITTESYRLYAYNPNQMFLPNHEETFGSQYLKIDSPAKSNTLTAVRTNSYYQEYKISRTHWMSLDHEESRCNSRQSKENTTKCITEYLESKIGCSMGLQLSLTGLKRLIWAHI